MKLGMKTGILAAETALSAESGGLFLPVELITGGSNASLLGSIK